nr:MAG TPA: hypothetical protein [Caudoviricetes sp.]
MKQATLYDIKLYINSRQFYYFLLTFVFNFDILITTDK